MFNQLDRALNLLGYNTVDFFEYSTDDVSSIIASLPDDPAEWTEKVRILKGKPFSFVDRPYLLPLYRDKSKEIHIVKPRQMEITEFALNWLLYKLTKNPYTVGLYLSDRQNHVSVFSNLRLQSGAIAQSPILRKLANKCHRVSWQSFKNESHLYMYSAWDDFESARSIPADFAVIDEVQSTNVAAIAVLMESLSKSPYGNFLSLGTGSFEGDYWHQMWQRGNQLEWDIALQKWVPQNPSSNISSYHFTQYMAPWLSREKIEEKRFKYTARTFANEVEGLWYKSMRRPLTEKDIDRLQDKNLDFTPADQVNHTLPVFAGFDWGGGTQAFTVAWIWQMVNEAVPRFKVLNVIKMDDPSTEAQADKAIELIDKYQVDQVVMDSGGGVRQVEKLSKRYGPRVYKCSYRYNSEDPVEIITREHRINCDRTWGIETIVDLITRPEPSPNDPKGIPKVHMPFRDPNKVRWITDHLTCIESENAEVNGRSIVKYTHGEESNDDALHAMVYAYLAWVITKAREWTWVRFG